MDAEGLEAVHSYLKRTYPDVATKIGGTYSRVSFGGAEFLHENEWDEPYLLSRTSEGHALLRLVRKQFS